MTAHEMLIDRALADGFTITVFDDGECLARAGTEKAAILSAVTAVDECNIMLRRGKEKHWAYIVHDCDADETVADYGVCEYLDKVMDEIFEQFS